MTIAIRVTGDNRELRDAIATWFAEARWPAPETLTLHIRVSPEVPAVEDGRPVVNQSALHIVAGGAGRDLRIGWAAHPATAVMTARGRLADVVLSPQAAANLDACIATFLQAVVFFLLRRTGWHHVHAATAVDPLGRGWLLAGNANAGKSTTTALLATRGWHVGTDDVAFLARNGAGVVVHAPRLPIALRPGGEALLRPGGGIALGRRGKTGFFPEDLGGTWTPRIRPDIVAMPTVGPGPTRLEPLGAADTLAELVRWSSIVALEHDLAQEHLDLLGALGSQARAFRLHLGADLFTDPNPLVELLP